MGIKLLQSKGLSKAKAEKIVLLQNAIINPDETTFH